MHAFPKLAAKSSDRSGLALVYFTIGTLLVLGVLIWLLKIIFFSSPDDPTLSKPPIPANIYLLQGRVFQIMSSGIMINDAYITANAMSKWPDGDPSKAFFIRTGEALEHIFIRHARADAKGQTWRGPVLKDEVFIYKTSAGITKRVRSFRWTTQYPSLSSVSKSAGPEESTTSSHADPLP